MSLRPAVGAFAATDEPPDAVIFSAAIPATGVFFVAAVGHGAAAASFAAAAGLVLRVLVDLSVPLPVLALLLG